MTIERIVLPDSETPPELPDAGDGWRWIKEHNGIAQFVRIWKDGVRVWVADKVKVETIPHGV